MVCLGVRRGRLLAADEASRQLVEDAQVRDELSACAALVSALSTAVGLTEGFDSSEAMISVGFGLIVLCDAATLRRASGEHARLLNRIVRKLSVSDDLKIEAEHLQERLGHRRREVLAGVLFGIATAFVVCGVWDFWK